MSLFGLRRSVGLVAVALLLGLVTAGCGAAGQANPEKIGPRGVDELVIPTPDPDPDDFVDAVTNPWLPLAPGTIWTYDVAGSEVQQLEVRVEERRKVVAGVSCVVVHTTGTDRDGQVVVEGDAFYAQDARGNVWLFGEESRGLVPATRGLTRSWRADERRRRARRRDAVLAPRRRRVHTRTLAQCDRPVHHPGDRRGEDGAGGHVRRSAPGRGLPELLRTTTPDPSSAVRTPRVSAWSRRRR